MYFFLFIFIFIYIYTNNNIKNALYYKINNTFNNYFCWIY